eukprot:TRINITY_DN18708_c0_g1_i4.p1 TRINITY_DN18708_c0_g1~~TRINITY_DN18708_c0_g1_i4.p1  ORF type:complete len:313 (-),score=45.46 TRINITY_DN18708_c0_g1_i4:165-1028(-)
MSEQARSVCQAQASHPWLAEDNRRMLHAVYRVGNMEETIEYYKKHFGMKTLRYRDIPEEKYSNAFLGYGPETEMFCMEFTYNYGVDSYDLGSGFGHFALGVEDVYKTVDSVKAGGGKVTRDAGPVKGGTSIIAFVEDPTGYKFELLNRPGTKAPICQVMLRVGDLDKSIKYYTEVLGMNQLRVSENKEYNYTLGFVGYEDDEKNQTVVELTYNHGVTEYEKGNAYAQVAISTKDVYKTAEQIEACGGTITRPPGPVSGIGTKIVATTDPDGWKYVFVDEEDFLNELK